MRTGRPGKHAVLKYVVLAVIFIYIALLMVFTSGSNKPFKEVAVSVENALGQSDLQKMDGQALKRYYGLNSADYDGVLLYSAQSSMSAEEVLLIKVKDDSQVQEVTDAIDEYLRTQREDFEGYAPEEVKLLDDAQRSVRGDYIFLAVSGEAQRYKEAFDTSL